MCDPRYRVLEVGSHSRTWVNVTPGTEAMRWGHCGHVTKSAKFVRRLSLETLMCDLRCMIWERVTMETVDL